RVVERGGDGGVVGRDDVPFDGDPAAFECGAERVRAVEDRVGDGESQRVGRRAEGDPAGDDEGVGEFDPTAADARAPAHLVAPAAAGGVGDDVGEEDDRL